MAATSKNLQNIIDLNQDSANKTDPAESIQEPKLKFPRSISFILVNEICERFCFYGLRAVLVIYLKDKLSYSESQATSIYHGFTFLLYFTCIFGSYISDGLIGSFFTILSLSIVYCLGVTILAVGSIFTLNLPAIELTTLGLILIGLGAGGIKPCVSAFAGNQFKLPEQARQLSIFFSLFYFSINIGSLLSTILTPIFRVDVQCFGDDSCFPLAFGFPAILMFIAIVVFVIGYPLYKMTKPAENIFAKVFVCLWTAIKTRHRGKNMNPKEHWLDYAEGKCDKKLVLEVKILMKILLLFVPLPLFWGLFEQQGSRWTFQAAQMNGSLGAIDLKPDQMHLINAALILLFIPLYQVLFYPILDKLGLSTPLRRMTFGGVLAGISFLLAALVDSVLLGRNPPHTVSMLWLIPQYVVMTLGEVAFSVTGLEFSFSQAPIAMKSVLQACWLLTVAFGNLIVVIVSSCGRMDHQWQEFLLFACFMFLAMGVFAWLAHRYKPISLEEIQNVENEMKIFPRHSLTR